MNRRDFLTHAAMAAVGVAVGRLPVWEADASVSLPLFSRSFVINTAPWNSVRFWIEARTLVDGSALYKCAGMKAEDTFAESNLFIEDNYDFTPIFADNGWALLLRRGRTLAESSRQVVRDHWGAPRIELIEAPYRPLFSARDIREATLRGVPMMTRSTFQHGGREVVIDCPTKTMNVTDSAYQVDVGPVALPDAEREGLEHVRLAFLAFSAPDLLTLITQQPVSVDGVEVLHYTDPFDVPALNEVFARV